jgi:hypothetical protein
MNNDYRLTDRQQELYDALRKGAIVRRMTSGTWFNYSRGVNVTRQAQALIDKGLCVASHEDHGFYTVTTLELATRATHLTGGAI